MTARILTILAMVAVLGGSYYLVIEHRVNYEDVYREANDHHGVHSNERILAVPVDNIGNDAADGEAAEHCYEATEPSLCFELLNVRAQISLAQSARIALALTGIGLLLLGITLYYTRSAAHSTKETLRIATDTMRQSRAWITPRVQKFDDGHQMTADDGVTHFCMYWANSGESPALNVRWRMGFAQAAKIDIGDYAKATMRDFPIRDVWRQVGVVGRGQQIPCWIPISAEWREIMRKRDTITLLQIEFSYNTVFDDQKKTTIVTYDFDLTGEFPGGKERFAINPIGHSNTAT